MIKGKMKSRKNKMPIYVRHVKIHIPEEVLNRMLDISFGNASAGIRVAVEKFLLTGKKIEPRHFEQATNIICDCVLSELTYRELSKRYPQRGGIKHAVQAIVVQEYGS